MPITSRANAEALIQEQLLGTIQQEAPRQSIAMQLMRRLPNMTSNRTRMPVLDCLPMAYWVSGDTGFKQTTSQAWDNVFMDAEELAVIVPIPEAVLSDASYDIMGEIRPRILEAIGQRVDQAVIFGVNKPASWRADIITSARQAGNNIAAPDASNDLYDRILGDSGVFGKVESGGYGVTGAMAPLSFKASLRGLRDSTGQPIFKSDMQGATSYALDGNPLYFPDNGAFDASIARLIAGAWSRAVYAIRQDITVKILDQGVIQNPTTKVIEYNLAQQDMIALRVVMRMGWAMPNPATTLDGDRTTCPFAYLEPATAVTTQTATFTVKDNASTPAAVVGAYVEVNGARLKTNASGQAVFNLRAGTYAYTVRKSDYVTASGTITVASSAVTQAVTIAAV